MEIYIVRHTSVKNTSGICYGQTDVALNDTFLEEVSQIKQKLPVDFDKVYSSTSNRCTALAKQLHFGEIEYREVLLEMNFGNWDGKNWNEIGQAELNKWMEDFVHVRVPNGENLIELYNRVVSFLDELSKQNYEKVLIVTHAGVIRCTWAYVLQFPLENIFKVDLDFGDISVIKHEKTGYKLMNKY